MRNLKITDCNGVVITNTTLNKLVKYREELWEIAYLTVYICPDKIYTILDPDIYDQMDKKLGTISTGWYLRSLRSASAVCILPRGNEIRQLNTRTVEQA
jgi:hypothetical protein